MRTYITAVEAISWIAFSDFAALDIYLDSTQKSPENNKKIRQATNIFLEVLRAERIEIFGLKKSRLNILSVLSEVEVSKIPIGVLLRGGIHFDLRGNELCFLSSYGQNLPGCRPIGAPEDYTELKVKREDIIREFNNNVAVKDSKDSANINKEPSLKKSGKTRGKKPKVMEKVRDKMVANIRGGKTTREQLERDTEECLATEYNHSRETVRNARKAALEILDSDKK